MKTLVEVIWMDASSGEMHPDELGAPKDLLFEQRSYGILYRSDDVATLILQGETTDEIMYTVIPNKWIKEIIEYHPTKK